jgi:hypothetical protein
LGYIHEAAIRNQILQSLSVRSDLYKDQAVALCILFDIAGATFDAYVDPSVINHCFELLRGYQWYNEADEKRAKVRLEL